MDYIPLKNALSFIVDNRGRTCPTATEGMPLIATNCVKNSSLYPVFEKVRFVDEHTLQTWFRAHPLPGDLIFVLKGSPGQVCLAPDPVNFCIAQDMVALRANLEVIDPSYLFATLRSSETQFNISNLHVGSLIAHFKKGDFDRLEIPLPTMNMQKEIGAIYMRLSEKIELNRRMSSTLEEMARSLYRSWFVDFDPVNAKMEGRQPAFMDEATAALFPDRFGEDGLPEGWMRQSIGNHFVAHKGLSYNGSGLCNEDAGLPLHNLNSVLEGGGYKYSGIKYYSEDYRERHTVRPGDLIVANTEQGFDHMLIGHSAIVPRNFGPMGLFSHHLFKVEPKSRSWLSREWLYLTLSVSPAGTVVRSFSNGTTVNMLPADAFEIPQIIVPAEAVVDRFNDLISPWFNRRDEAINQASTLAALRDSLLPKLMSGELRVGEAREQVEEVA